LPEVSIDIEGMEVALRKLAGFGPGMGKEVSQAIGQGLLLIANVAKKGAPVDRGQYRASIGATGRLGIREVKTLGAEIIGRVGTKVKYAPYIEFGRRPGKMPPVSVIEEWAKRHHMAGMGFVIARAIGRRGIKAKHVLENAAKSQANTVYRMISQAVERAAKKF